MNILKDILDNKKEEVLLLKKSFPIGQIKEGIIQKNYPVKSLFECPIQLKVSVIVHEQ